MDFHPLGPWGNTDGVDLFQVHRPDPDTAIDEIVAPGATSNIADAGWISPGLDVIARRRK